MCCRLLRVSWETVHAVVIRVVDEHLDDARLDGLFNLGVDEISYKRGYQYLTVIADHDTGTLAQELRAIPTASFFAADEIGPVGDESFLHGFTATMAVFPS